MLSVLPLTNAGFSDIIKKKRFIYFGRWYNIDYRGYSKSPIEKWLNTGDCLRESASPFYPFEQAGAGRSYPWIRNNSSPNVYALIF